MQTRRALPPWPIVVCVTVVVLVRIVSSQLDYRADVPWEDSAMEAGMGLSLLGFWFWPPRSGESLAPGPSLRLALQLGVVYLLLLGPCERAHDDHPVVKWILLHRPIYFFLLSHGIARLLTRLRLDANASIYEALGPTALFLFWGLMLPAGLQALPDDSPRALTALLLVVPLATFALLRIYVGRSVRGGPWWRELSSLSLRYWSLPVLFMLGELAAIFLGTIATLD